jgi:hypothetical protein
MSATRAIQDVTLLSARRAYDFPVDGIRLTILSNMPVLRHLQALFGFEVATIGMPVETFGPVPATFPPGLVFSYGLAPYPEGDATPVRFLHVEPNRIVADVAGPTSVTEQMYDRFRAEVQELRSPEGPPVLGEPVAVRDYSEITFRAPFALEATLPPALVAPYRLALQQADAESGVIVPALQFTHVPQGETFPGSGLTRSHRTAVLELRVGSTPADGLMYSAAPLGTDDHLVLLDEVARALATGEESALPESAPPR